MNQVNLQSDVIGEVIEGLGVITLDRQKSLNALSLEMIRQITALLKKWENDDSVQAVLFKGAGDKAFCSGGDIKSFYSAGMDFRRGHVSLKVPALFFGEEYNLNRYIYHYSKPTIVFMNGITMGGGYGIAGNCKYRVACENTVFAMPEIFIGFFPDVGACYHLSRAPKNYGRYLALTGGHIGAGDMLAAGLADCYVETHRYEELQKAVIEAGGSVDAALSAYKGAGPNADIFDRYSDAIEAVFSSLDVPEILHALGKADNDFRTHVIDLMGAGSPLSIYATARHLDVLADQDFDTVIEADFERAQNFIKYPDLYEGIRALLIDKDKVPSWSCSNLDDVTEDDVERYFAAGELSLKDI